MLMETWISSSTMDKANKIKTSAMLFIIYGICIFPALDGNLNVLLGLFAFCSLFCLVTRGLMPNRYILDREKILIDAYFLKTCIRIDEIVLVRQVDQSDLGVMIRTFGFGWLFGDLGYFTSSVIGHIKVFARRSDNRILITTSNHGNYVIAPDDPEFIHYLERATHWR